MRKLSVAGLALVLVGGLSAVVGLYLLGRPSAAAEPAGPAGGAGGRAGVAKFIDLGARSCIPCKMMAPMLDELKKEFPGRLDVTFVDVNERENLPVARQYGIQAIPTQIFLDAEGRELARHMGFITRYGILDKFRELGYAFAAEALKPAFSRLEPAKADERPKGAICFMCDGDLNPKTVVVVKSEKGDVRLCGPHCYFILYSCLTQDKAGFDGRASAIDWAGGKPAPMIAAIYLCGLDEKTGRPTIKAFAERGAAEAEQKVSGGSLVGYEVLKGKELAVRCGFCDRSVYPEDAAQVKIGGVHSYGCCSHCAMGVAARTGRDIEVRQPDRLTGEMVVVKTLGGYIVAVEPATAVAWFGKKKMPDGSFVSAGCFHQGFFASLDNLRKWCERNPTETGHMITIDQALGDKMKMSPEQVAKACKVGECAPK